MLDELPAKPLNDECGILNLDAKSGPGTHWVCYRKKDGNVTYFDPFGNLRPPTAFLEYMRGNKITYNRDRLQSWNTPFCGHWCLLFLSKNF